MSQRSRQPSTSATAQDYRSLRNSAAAAHRDPDDRLEDIPATIASPESETILLGTAMRGTRLTAGVAEKMRGAGMTTEWFSTHQHRLIWDAICADLDSGVVPEAHTVAERLIAAGDDLATAHIETSRLVESVGFVPNWERYFAIVRDKHRLRRLAERALLTLQCAAAPDADPTAETARAEEAFFTLAQSGRLAGDTAERLAPTVARLKTEVALWERGEADAAATDRMLTWGLPILDKKFTRLDPAKGDLVIGLLGMSSHGKSTFARHMVGANILAGKTAVVFSLETSRDMFVQRLAGLYSCFDVAVFRRENPDGSPPSLTAARAAVAEASRRRASSGNAGVEHIQALKGNPDQTEAAARAVAVFDHNLICYRSWLDYLGTIADERLHVFQTASTIDSIIAKMREQLRQRTVHMFVVDYLQIVQSEKHRVGKAGWEILKDVAMLFKSFAQETCVPVLLVSSITDRGEHNGNTTPSFTDARGSLDISYALDRAIVIFRPDNGSDGSPQERNRALGLPVLVRVKQSKSRDLPIWEETLLFHGKTGAYFPLPRKDADGDTPAPGRPKGVRNGMGKANVGVMPPGLTIQNDPLAPYLEPDPPPPAPPVQTTLPLDPPPADEIPF
ncbi:MAG: hypothetical protein LBR07_05185 [Puniceicoccales bacterium]|jgi:replicative DNA helicase|nr:hypothetical protein [Puniceicoccales bacterium]